MKKIYTINLGKQEYNGEGNLDLRGTQITSLPEGLKVGGHLYLRDTQITSLPEGLKVGGNLYLEGTPIKGKYKVVNKKVVKVRG